MPEWSLLLAWSLQSEWHQKGLKEHPAEVDQTPRENNDYSGYKYPVFPRHGNHHNITNQKLKPRLGGPTGHSELASVTHILNATMPNRFQTFLPRYKIDAEEKPGTARQEERPEMMIRKPPAVHPTGLNPDFVTSTPFIDKAAPRPSSGSGEACIDLTGSGPLSLYSCDPEEDSQMSFHSGLIPNSGSGKKKRNSYADSPHKLTCPYCPRAFPWISSLKRHILTHTGGYPDMFLYNKTTTITKNHRTNDIDKT